MLIFYLNIQTCACQLILIHVDKILELEMADFFVIENSPLEQLPLTLWILCATFYNVILEYARGAF